MISFSQLNHINFERKMRSMKIILFLLIEIIHFFQRTMFIENDHRTIRKKTSRKKNVYFVSK